MRGLLLVAPCILAASLAAQAPVFRASVDFVAVDVSVRRSERPVTGLSATDFEVRDAGIVQKILDVSYESSPIDITLAVDLSSSVRGALLQSLARAVDRVATTLKTTDRVHLVTFNQAVRERAVPVATTGRPLPLSSALGTPSGVTSLFDALVASVIRPRDLAYRPMLIVFTDGDDSMSFVDERTVLEVVRRSGTSMFMVGAVQTGTVVSPRPAMKHRALFEALTSITGGEGVVLGSGDDIGDAFVRALTAFRESYVLRYEPETARRAGWHDLAVKVLRDGKFDVRARQGYFVAGK